MKKRVLFCIIAMILTNTIPCFAHYADANWDMVIEKVEQGEHGGIYVDSGVDGTRIALHIKPVSEEDKIKMEQIVFRFAPNSNIIIDDVAKYSMTELQEAQGKTNKIWKELQLNYVAIRESINGLMVGSYLEWTEERKALFIKTTGIENVEFEMVEKGIDIDDVANSIEYSPYLTKIEKGEGTFYQNEMKNCIMIPVTEAITVHLNYCDMIKEKSNQKQNNDKKVIFQKEKDNSIKITFKGNEIIFLEGKRDVFVNGIRMGLESLPDIKEEEIFLPVQDFLMIEENAVWDFENNKITQQNRKEQRTFRISTEYDGTIFSLGKNRKKETEKTISVYEKNNHMMIAIKDISRFMGTNKYSEVTWNSENNTVILKIWHDIAKDVVFTKDSNKMLVDGIEIEMEQAAEIKNNRLYIPITALFNILELPEESIEWIQLGKNVKITY